MVRNITIFYGEELLAPRPTPKLEDHPLSAVRDCLFHVFAATPHNWRPFLHPQPEDAPCRGDRDPHNTGRVITLFIYTARSDRFFYRKHTVLSAWYELTLRTQSRIILVLKA
jgi:hypothetical protein